VSESTIENSTTRYETQTGKPGSLAVVPGMVIILIASLILFIGLMNGGSAYGPPMSVYIGMGGIPLGVFLVTTGYLYRIARALEVSNQLGR